MISSALAPRYDVVDFQVSGLEVRRTARAVAFLQPVQRRLVRSVWRELAQVGTARYVRAVRSFVEQTQFVAHPALDKLSSLLRDVDTDPVTLQVLSCDAGRRAAAKGVKHDVSGVRTGGDDPAEQGKRLLRRVADALFGARVDWRDIGPKVGDSLTWHFVKEALQLRHPTLGVNPTFYVQRRHFILRHAPCFGHAVKLVNRPPPAWRIEIGEAVAPPIFVLVCELGLDVFVGVWLPHGIEGVADTVEQNAVGDRAKPLGVSVKVKALPNNLVPKRLAPKHRVHGELQVVAHCRVTVEINASGGLHDSVHFQQPHRHVCKVGLVAVRNGCQQNAMQRRMLGFNQIDPFHVDVGKRPGVLEFRACCFGPDRSGVVGLGVKWRVEVNQIHRLAVHAAHDRQIVSCPDRPVGPVRIHGHG